MKRRTALGMIALTPAAAAAMFSCAPPSAEDDTTLLVGATLAPPMLDPVVNDAASIPQALLYNVYETLVKLDDNGEMQPLLASSWEISPERTSYTFHLDERATFASDNRAVTAEDVVWSLERTRTEGRAVLKNEMSPVDTIEATDERTVTVTLTRPSNSWLYAITSTSGFIYDSKAGVDFASQAAGSGPYTVQSWAPGSDLVLSRRDDYWGPVPYFSEVTLRYFADANSQNSAMLSGQLDILSSLQAPQALPQFDDRERFAVIEGTTQGEVVMAFNNSGILKDKRLRQAIRHAVDHQALLDTVWAGHGTLIGSMVPPTDPWYEDLTGLYPYDPTKASELVEEAGYDRSTPLRMRLPVVPYATASGQFVASALRDVGFQVKVEELDFARWLDQVLVNADYDLSIVSHVEPRDLVKFADPTYYWRYDNPTVQELVAEADTGTEEEQRDKMAEAARIISEDAASDWLFLLPNLAVTTPDIRGIRQNATTLSFDLTTLSREA